MIKNIWKAVKPYCTWKMLPIVGTMYLFTNAIWYVLAFTPHIPSWLAWVARGYLAFIWTPFGVEKVVIVVGAEKTSGLSDSVTDTECTIAAYLESDIVVSLVSSTTIALVTAIAEKNNFSASLQSTLTTLCSMNIRVPLYFEVDELGSVTAISSDATLSESITFDISKCSTSDLSAGMTLLVTSILADYDNNTWASIDNSILYLFDHIEK